MRILHTVSAPAAGGAEVYVKDLTKRLARYGHDVTVAFLGHARDIGRSEDYETGFLRELEENGVSWFFIGNECRKKPWLGMRRVRQFVKNHKIEVFHSHLPFGVVFSAGLPCQVVYTHHSINPRLGWLTYRIFNQIIDRYIGISAVCAERLSRFTGRDVTSILNGVDVEKFAARDLDTGSQRDTIHAISVGRIHPHKGYYFLAEAIQSLPSELRPRIRVSVAGEGEPQYTADLKRFLADVEVADNFWFLGNRSDVPQLLAEADLFLMSSEQEGLPISLIEASVSGLPCIVTDVGGCREIIEMCRNGIAVDFGDTEAYAHEIQDLIENPEKLKKWSANAVDNCAELDIESAAQKHLDLYRELLGARG